MEANQNRIGRENVLAAGDEELMCNGGVGCTGVGGAKGEVERYTNTHMNTHNCQTIVSIQTSL